MDLNYEDRKIMLTEAVWNPEKNRINIAKCIFEKFGFSHLQIGI